MTNTNGLTDTERDRIRELHTQGVPCNAIARQMGRSPSTVSRTAKAMGLDWDASRTAAATERKQASNRDRRAGAIRRMYDQADKLLDRLDQPTYKLVGMDKDGYARTNVIDQDAVPAADVRALHASAVNLLNTAARLELVDAGHTGQGEARGILGALQDTLAAAYGSLSAANTHVPDGDDLDDVGA